jgi:hypothetical protein
MNSILIGLGLIAIFALIIFSRQTTSRNSYEWKNIRLRVLKRDNYTCQNSSCAQKGGYLEVHHIKSWNAYPD